MLRDARLNEAKKGWPAFKSFTKGSLSAELRVVNPWLSIAIAMQMMRALQCNFCMYFLHAALYPSLLSPVQHCARSRSRCAVSSIIVWRVSRGLGGARQSAARSAHRTRCPPFVRAIVLKKSQQFVARCSNARAAALAVCPGAHRCCRRHPSHLGLPPLSNLAVALVAIAGCLKRRQTSASLHHCQPFRQMAAIACAVPAVSMRCFRPSSVQQLISARRTAAATIGGNSSSRRGLVVAAAGGTYSGKDVNPPAKGHHFLHIDDFSREELRECTALPTFSSR